MTILSAFVQFVLLCSLWAGLCFAVYAALRLFGRRFPLALSCLGALALAFWCMVFCALAVLAGESWADGPVGPAPPYPYLFVGSVGAVLLTTLASGGWLIRQITGKSWWQGMLACSLYLMVAHPVCGFGLGITGIASLLASAWMKLAVAVGISPASASPLTNLWPLVLILMWAFPIGAPIAEISVHNFRRLLRTHQQGYPA